MKDQIIPADSAKWLVNEIRNFGVEPKQLLKGTGLSLDWLKQVETTISPQQYIKIIENALVKTGEPALGLKIGDHLNLSAYGVWGYAIISCSTLGEAADVVHKFWDLNGSLTNTTRKYDEEDVIVEILPAFDLNDRQTLMFAVEELLSTTSKATYLITHRKVPIKELHLAYPKPDHASLYKNIFEGPIYFNADITCYRFSSRYWEIPTVMAHPTMADICQKQCAEMLLKLRKSDKLVENIRRLFVNSAGQYPRIDDTAYSLGLSPRTLSRKLLERNTSYQEILDDVRAELAKDYLCKTNLSTDQVAELIGFKETAAFRKAFKKWTGTNASVFKRKSNRFSF